jgi:predicted metalloprotease
MKAILLIGLLVINQIHLSAQNENCFGAKNGDVSFDNIQLFSTSGNQHIDQVTIQELLFMNTRFLVYPVLFFYDGDNAMATRKIYSPKGPDGTVAFGHQLFNSLLIRDGGFGAAIPIVIAHEFGHIVQFKYGGFKNVSNMRKELFADYLAGAYLAIRGGLDVNVVLEAFEDMGDTEFGSVDHHGSPEQRRDALLEGYNHVFLYGSTFTLSAAIRLGKEYVNSIEDYDPDIEDPE